MGLVLTGTIVTFDPEQPLVRDGAVYIHDGVVDAVRPRRAAPPAGFGRARQVATGGNVYPGLIDLHNHLAYNFLPLWKAPKEVAYTSRHQWPGAATYGRDISNPAQAMGIAAAAAALRYAEVRAIVGGVTAIQGSPPLTRAFPGWMVRNVEKESFPDRKSPLVVQAVIKADVPKLRSFAKHLDQGRSFIYHLAEGTDSKLRTEFQDLRSAGCVRPQLIGIHCTALQRADFAEWAASGGGSVVWSPFSNIWLYGDTTDVLEARRRGLTVCLGSDWGPSGTRSVLGELKVAALWNDEALGGALSPQELCEMVTANPGDALAPAWGRHIGRLRAGSLADAVVTAARDADVYRSLCRSSERHVRLVVVGGRPVYGNRALMKGAGATHLEPISVAGISRAITMRLPADRQPENPALAKEANLSWKEGLAAMQAVVDDPVRAVTAARRRKPRAGIVPLEFQPDMPGPDNAAARALTDDELRSLLVPPIEPLWHDAGWFARVDRGHPHSNVLSRLRPYFR